MTEDKIKRYITEWKELMVRMFGRYDSPNAMSLYDYIKLREGDK